MAGSAVVGLLKVLLTADTAEFDSAMRRVSSSAGAWSKDLASMGRQATQLGSALTKTLTLPILGLGIGAAKAAMDFESAFAGVRKTVDATDVEFAQMAQAFRDLAKEIPVSVNELANLGAAAGALGVPKAEIVDFARVMALLGVTTNLTSDQAADSIARIQNIFGAAGQDTDRLASTIVALGNAGASTEVEITEMAQRIAGAGHTVGLTQAQVVGFASALASVGINAEAGGSAISRIFLKMNDAVSKGGAGLAEFARVAGMSAAEFKTAFEHDAAGATVAFINGLGRLKASGENINGTITDLIGKNIILKDTLFRLSGAGSLLTDQLKLADQAWKDNTALTIEANERFKTTESQLALLWNRIKDVAITIGNALLPMIQQLVKWANDLLPIVDQLAKSFANLPTALQFGAVGFLGLVAAAGPVLYVFGQLLIAGGAIVGAFGKAGLATRAIALLMDSALFSGGALTTALGVLAGAVAVAATAFAAWKLGRWIGDASGLTDGIGKLSAKLGEFVGLLPKGSAAQYDAMRAAEKAAEASHGQAKALDAAGASAAAAVPPLAKVGETNQKSGELTKAAKAELDRFNASLKALGGADALAGAREVVKQLAALDGPLHVLPGKLAEMAARLREGAEAAAMKGWTQLANDYTKLADTLSPLIQFQQRYGVTLRDVAYDSGLAASETADLWEQFFRLTGAVQTVTPKLKELQSSLNLKFDVFGGLWATFGQDLTANMPSTKTWEAAWTGMKDGLGKVLAGVPGTIARAFEGGGNILGAVVSIGSQLGAVIGKGIGESIKMLGKFGGPIGEAIGSLAGPIIEMFAKMFDHVGKDVARIASSYGVQVGDAFRAAVKDSMKTLGLTEQAATLFNIDKLFPKIDAGNLNQALRAVHDLFSMIETGQLSAKQATEALEKVFPQLAAAATDANGRVSDSFKELIALAHRFGLESKAIQEWEQGQATNALSGFSAVVAGAKPAIDSWHQYGEAVRLARENLKGLSDPADMEAAAEAMKRLRGALVDQSAAAAGARQELSDLGVQALATFNAAIASGMTYAQALGQIGPALTTLQQAYKDLGLDVDNAALSALFMQNTILTSNPQLIAGVNGLSQEMIALSNMGLLNAETFGAMQRTGEQMYSRLQAATAAAGGTTRDALLPMQDYLHRAAEQAELLGIPLDDNTQLLIDQSKELGIWKDTGKSANQLMLDMMTELVKVMKELAAKIGGVGSAIADIPDRTVNIGWHVDPFPDLSGYGMGMSGVTVPVPVQGPFAAGTKGVTGHWFQDFGTGTLAQLDNIEAVVRPDQSMDFALDVIGRANLGAPAPSPATVNVYVGVDPQSGRIRVLGDSERAQVQQWLNSGQVQVPQRAITSRVR